MTAPARRPCPLRASLDARRPVPPELRSLEIVRGRSPVDRAAALRWWRMTFGPPR